MARLTGPENIDPERPRPGLQARATVNSHTRITPENNGKIRPQPDRENAFAGASGGERGIRTLETVPRLHTFQACAFDHSAISPHRAVSVGRPKGATRAVASEAQYTHDRLRRKGSLLRQTIVFSQAQPHLAEAARDMAVPLGFRPL